MNLLPGTVNLLADGQVGSGTKPCRVFCVTLVSGGTLSTTILRNGTTTAGTAFEQIDGIANSAVTKSYAGGMLFPRGCFLDTDANISYVTVIFTEEL